MESLVARLESYRVLFEESHAQNSEDLPPTQENLLRQLTFHVISEFLQTMLDPDTAYIERFMNSLEADDDRDTESIIDEWVTKTYGWDESSS